MKIVEDLLNDVDNIDFVEQVTKYDKLHDVIKFIRNHSSIRRLVLACKNSKPSAQLILEDIDSLLEEAGEGENFFIFDPTLAALLLVLVDSKHVLVNDIANAIMNYDHVLYWSSIMATNYYVASKLDKASA